MEIKKRKKKFIIVLSEEEYATCIFHHVASQNDMTGFGAEIEKNLAEADLERLKNNLFYFFNKEYHSYMSRIEYSIDQQTARLEFITQILDYTDLRDEFYKYIDERYKYDKRTSN